MAMDLDGNALTWPDHLRLSPPEEILRPPASTAFKYKIDPYERLVRADFSGHGSMRMDPVDEKYILELFEQPDVSVVIKGLAINLDPDLWNTRYLEERCGTVMYHNFRRFCKADEDPEGRFVAIPEVEKAWSSMRLSDYVRYLDERAEAARRRAERVSASPPRDAASVEDGQEGGEEGEESIDVEKGGSFSLGNAGVGSSAGSEACGVAGTEGHKDSMVFTSFDGKPRTVKLLQESMYLTDMDLTRYLPECAVDLERSFMMDILPGGASCAMKYMPRESRPFLGPNLYVTPPGSWTFFHQDGNGTVDSGHQCLTGRNHVVMLRRLNEEDKKRAMRILGGDLCYREDRESHGKGGSQGAKGGTRGGDSLYELPHGPGQKPPWPSDKVIKLLRELNYCPSVFTLEPGEFLHINKGRLHAFRKEEPLPHEDPGSICVSVAWDWVFKGVTEAGCRRELGYALQCTEDNRMAKSSSLAPIKTCVLQAAKSSLAMLRARALSCGQAPRSISPQLVEGAVDEAPPSLPIRHAAPAGAGISRLSSNGSSGTVPPAAAAATGSNGSSRRPSASAIELFSRLRDLLPEDVMGAEEGLGPEGVMALRALGGVDASSSSPSMASASPLSSFQRARTQPPTGLFSWIMTANSSSTEGSAGAVDPGIVPSSPLEAAVAAAREVLEIGARAAADAEASAKSGKTSDSVSCSSSAAASASAAGRSAMKAARFAMKAMLATSAVGDDGRVVGVSGGGVGSGAAGDLRMLSALAPLVEKIVATQRSQWTLQAKTVAYSDKVPKLNPSRPGKRKLGPAAAKARDDAIVASMRRMEQPIRHAVKVVEIDSSVPMHLQTINPFSSDDGFSCSSCRCELFNAYMHCFGCEVLLSKDLNLCLDCHTKGKLAFPTLGKDELGITTKCHCPSDPKATLAQREMKAVAYENTGRWPVNRCGCGQEACSQCHLCVACACDCHHRFQLRFRFEHAGHLERLAMGVRAIAGGVSTIPLHFSPLEASSAKDNGSSSNTINIQGGNVDGDGLTQPSESKKPKTNGCRVNSKNKPNQGSGDPRGTIASVGGTADGASVRDPGASDASAGVEAVVAAPPRESEEVSKAGRVDGCPLREKRKRSDDGGDVPPGGYDGAFDGAEEVGEGKRRRVEGSSKKSEGDDALDGLGASGQRTANISSSGGSSSGGDSCINIE